MPTAKLSDSTSTMPPASSTCPKSRPSPSRRRARRSETGGRYPRPVIAGHRYVVSRRRLGALTSHGTRAAPASPPPLAGEGQGRGTQKDRPCALTPSPPLPRKREREQTES